MLNAEPASSSKALSADAGLDGDPDEVALGVATVDTGLGVATEPIGSSGPGAGSETGAGSGGVATSPGVGSDGAAAGGCSTVWADPAAECGCGSETALIESPGAGFGGRKSSGSR